MYEISLALVAPGDAQGAVQRNAGPCRKIGGDRDPLQLNGGVRQVADGNHSTG
jgi:hypothetical protein